MVRFWFIFLLLVVGQSSIAATWQVNLDGSGDFNVMQEAVDIAVSGDTI